MSENDDVEEMSSYPPIYLQKKGLLLDVERKNATHYHPFAEERMVENL